MPLLLNDEKQASYKIQGQMLQDSNFENPAPHCAHNFNNQSPATMGAALSSLAQHRKKIHWQDDVITGKRFWYTKIPGIPFVHNIIFLKI